MDKKTPPDHQKDFAENPVPDVPILNVGEFRIDLSTRRLMKGNTRVRIQHRPLDVLIHLAQNSTRLVTRAELLEKFWPRAVNEEALTRCISTIRKNLDDIQDPPRYIETLWGQGYRCIAHVSTQLRNDRDSEKPAVTDQEQPGGLKAYFGLGKLSARFSRNQLSMALAAMLLVVIGLAVILRNVMDTTISNIDRIAVLPIKAPDDEDWVVAAMTDQLIQTISRIEGVAVVARGSVMQFSAESDPIEIGARLKVDAVLVSELDRSQGSARLSSELVSSKDGSVLWNFHVEPAQASTEKQQIVNLAGAVARRLWANLQLRKSERLVTPAAYRHYLRGRYYWNQRSGTGLDAAIDSFNAALELEPNYIDALTGLADSWLLMPLYGATAPIEAIPRARAAAEHALRLDPDQAHAHAVIGVIKMQFDWDWVDAESHLRKAVTLNPNDSTALQWLGELNCYQARFDQCRRYYNIASSLDPLSPVLRMLQGSPDLYSGNFEAAVEAYQATLAEIPDFEFTHIGLAHSFVGLKDWDRAIASYETLLPDFGLEIVGGPLIYSLARKGEIQRARELLSELEDLALTRYVPPSKLAIAYLGLGDKSQALDLLWQAINAHDDRLVYLAVDNLFDDLHSDQEFRMIAERIGVLDVLDKRQAKSGSNEKGRPR
jgi:DNA-binding winged helix-turn-helix (wHTH) protein/TolB-like protein/Flp pilus assembly protein TadD